MKTPYSTLVIRYKNGAKQVVKPNMAFFQGDWEALANAVAFEYEPKNQDGRVFVKYELK